MAPTGRRGFRGHMVAVILGVLSAWLLLTTDVPVLGQSSDDQGYLVFMKPAAAGLALVTSTWDGSAHRELPLPPHTHIADLRRALSPAGTAVALHTVAAGDLNFYPSQPQGIRLHLMNLRTGVTVPITDVLPLGVVATLGSEQTYANLLSGIGTVAWSPDGRYLAFAALNGQSTDLHVLAVDQVGTARQRVVRFSDEPGNIQWIEWSPDGKSILYGVNEGGDAFGDAARIYRADLRRKGTALTAAGDRAHRMEWLDRSRILIFGTDASGAPYDLRTLDVTTGRQRTIWQPSWGYYGAIAVNHAADLLLALVAYPEAPDHNLNAPGLEPGLYLASATGRNPVRIAEAGRWSVKAWDSPDYPFLVVKSGASSGTQADESETGPGVYAVSRASKLVKIADDVQAVSLPEESAVGVFYGPEGLTAFGQGKQKIERVLLTSQLVENVFWLPQGRGIAYLTGHALHTVTRDPQPKLLDAPVYSAVVGFAGDPAAVGLQDAADGAYPAPTLAAPTRIPTRMPALAPTPAPTPVPPPTTPPTTPPPARPVPTLTPVHTLKGHRAGVWDVQYAPDGRTLLLTASDDQTARVWNTLDGREIAVLEGHTDKVWHANFAPDANRIVTAGLDGTARLWDLIIFRGEPAGAAQESGVVTHDGPVYDARFSPDGKRVVTAGGDGLARIWEPATGAEIDLRGHTDAVITAHFSPDGEQAVTASDDKTARLWDAATGEVLHVLAGHTGRVGRAEFAPDGSRLLTMGTDRLVIVWSSETGRELARLRGHDDLVWNAHFSPDGRRIVTAGWDGKAILWDARTGEKLLELEGSDEKLYSARFSPDGALVVTAGEDGAVRVWNATTGAEMVRLLGHQGPAYDATFSLDGEQIASVGEDTIVRLWEPQR